MKPSHAIAILLTLSTLACAQLPPLTDNPVEYGQVSWQRDLTKALTGTKPVFVLFQEVPG